LRHRQQRAHQKHSANDNADDNHATPRVHLGVDGLIGVKKMMQRAPFDLSFDFGHSRHGFSLAQNTPHPFSLEKLGKHPIFCEMAKPPLILVAPSIEKRGVEFHDLSVSLSVKYDFSVTQAGGVPVTVPTTTDRGILSECIARMDGVLLTGGDDINPGLYTKNLPRAIRKTVETTPDHGGRDLRELILLDEIFRQRKPLLAICRGHQLLNVALGGELIADIRRQIPQSINHQHLDKANEIVHEATLTPNSLLARITGKQILGVNSSHHQAVVKPAEPLTATAWARDGIVEAMELKPEARNLLPFLLSVQFHPERLTHKHAEHRAIFSRFIAACNQKSKK
jgi:putative glutamine amidotransferase